MKKLLIFTCFICFFACQNVMAQKATKSHRTAQTARTGSKNVQGFSSVKEFIRWTQGKKFVSDEIVGYDSTNCEFDEKGECYDPYGVPATSTYSETKWTINNGEAVSKNPSLSGKTIVNKASSTVTMYNSEGKKYIFHLQK